jgi:hypothetical protein
MNPTKITVLACLGACSFAASAQSAAVQLASSNDQPAPGETVTVTLSADFTLGGAGPGVFGEAGLYGFGGSVLASGDAGATATPPTVNADLGFGLTSTAPNAASLVRAGAGRGLEGGLATSPTDLMSFDVTIANDAAAGSSLTLTYDGALVLALGSTLTTYATDPGANQQTLAPASITLTIEGGGCNAADLAEPFGVLDLGDISVFVGGFTSGDPVADLAAPFGVFDLADISAFVGGFTAGCP